MADTQHLERSKLLNVTVKSPKKIEFDGEATAVSSFNGVGKFDVLPYHASFISLIKDILIIHLKNKEPLKIPLESGILKNYEDHVTVLIGIKTTA